MFSKSVVYPAQALVDAPDLPQSGGDTIDLPLAIDSASVSCRQGTLCLGQTVGHGRPRRPLGPGGNTPGG